MNTCVLCLVPDQKKAKGEELFDQIMYHLDIVEKDYFGLRFMDSAQVAVRTKLLCPASSWGSAFQKLSSVAPQTTAPEAD